MDISWEISIGFKDDNLSTILMPKSTYFQLGEEFYKQMDGAMGSPFSPVIANLYLESLEETPNTINIT